MATLVYTHDSNGGRITGELKILVDAVLAGETIRVKTGSEQDGYGLRDFQNVYVRNGHIFAQAVQFSWNWSPDVKGIVLDPQTAYYVFNLSTTGRCQRRVFNLHSPSNDDLPFQMAMSWYVVG